MLLSKYMDIIPDKAPSVETLSKKEIALNTAGATREAAYKSLVEGLSAQTMSLDKYGDEHYAPDHSTRIRAAEMISKLNGDMKEASVVVDNRQYNIEVPTESMLELLHMVKDVAGQLKTLRSSGQQTGEIIDVEHTSSTSNTA